MLSYQEKLNAFKEWAAGLKEGDTIAIRTGSRWGTCPYSVTTIAKITPSGRIKTANGYEFNPDGTVRGRDTYAELQSATDEIVELVTRYDLIAHIVVKAERKFLEKISTEDLKNFSDALTRIEEE